MSFIKIRGAKVHNLKNIDLDLPKNKLVVMTGVSGSGKSSLAFDTLYAEGQRRYVESLSSYARQFLGMLQKPDVESIEGLSPAISIDQKSTSHNPRSTVGTITEISDYLRLMYARIGKPFCSVCGTAITKLTLDEITDLQLQEIEKELKENKLIPQKFNIISPVVRDRKGEFSGILSSLRSQGYSQCFIDGTLHNLQDEILLIKTNKHTIEAVIDTVSAQYSQMKDVDFRASLRTRIFNSIEQATVIAGGLVSLQNDASKVKILYSQNYACPNCGASLPEIEPRIFSFNSPQGACHACHGLGVIATFDPRLVLNTKLSITEGAILPLWKLGMSDTWFGRLFNTVMEDLGIDTRSPLENVAEVKITQILFGNKKQYRVEGKNRFGEATAISEEWHGVIPILENKYKESESDWVKTELDKYQNNEKCGECEGKRLKKEVLNIFINDKNIHEVGELAIDDLAKFTLNLTSTLTDYEMQIVALILKEVQSRANFLTNVGLKYLTLNRMANSLSGGEAQRIRLASQIGSGLTGVMYVLDEPSIGLHPKDVTALVSSLKHLRDIGNSVFVVEHDPETIEQADHIVDFGPLAGVHGGEVVFTGSYDELKKANTLTSKYMFHEDIVAKVQKHKKEISNQGKLSLVDANRNNLKNISVEIPLGKLIGVTGVSGSGKSTLLIDTLYPALKYNITGSYDGNLGDFKSLFGFHYLDNVYLVDQSAIGRTPRSNPATYIGIFDLVRDIFAATPDAKAKGYPKGRFSFNVKGGRCEKCTGGGVIKIEMQFLPDVYVTCDVCLGKRYNLETLDVHYKNKSIYDVLEMTISEALEFFSTHPMIRKKLTTLMDIGLGYVKLGQTAPTLSGGEAQRIKVAHELSKRDTGRTIYILDEPTTGLHLYDVEKLLIALRELVNRGNTVVVIEHNLEVIKACDYLIDLGPDGGAGGGEIIFAGETDEIMNEPKSYTGQYLKASFDQKKSSK